MKIPSDAIIAPTKLTSYLLVERPWDDKSKFLAMAGFERDQPEVLEASIRQLAVAVEAVEDGTNEYGIFWRVDGPLHGPSGLSLEVTLIWLQWHTDHSFHFVTLKPFRKQP